MDKLVLFDVNNTLTRDAKSIGEMSEYVQESIRNIYGVLVEVDLSKYEGMTSQETAEAILLENGMPKEDIEQKLARYTEDLFYSYYNVAGHDKQLIAEGAKQLLDELSKEGVLIGMATGETEKIARFRLEKTSLDSYFRFGAFGNEAKSAAGIVAKAIEKAKNNFSFSGKAVLVSCYPSLIRAAKTNGILSVGIANGKFAPAVLSEAGADRVIASLRNGAEIKKLVE
jgi:phosphoglycolate phosphatase